MTEFDLRRAVVPAPLKVTYEALTDPAALRVWLAEHADVDLPGRYEFWGRFTPDGAEPHQRALHVDERTIRLAWTLDGVETTSQIELAEDEDGTLVTLSQTDLPSFEDVIADKAGALGTLQTFWSLAIANLADYLAGRQLTPMCDYTSAELRASMVIDAVPEQVFDSMVQPALFRRWFGANVDIEPHVGGRFAMGGFEVDPGGARFVEFEPGRKATHAVPRRPDLQLGARGLGRHGRAAALPRTADLALDLAPGRDRRPPRGHVRDRPMR